MGRKPKPIDPGPAQALRLIRQELGKTQAQMGQFLGCSMMGVQMIERGQRNLTLPLQLRLAQETGASQESIRAGIPRDTAGQPYTSGSFEAWRKRRRPENRPERIRSILFWTAVLLESAAEAGKARVGSDPFESVLFDLQQLIGKLRKDHRLERQTESMLQDFEYSLKVRFKVGDVRKWPSAAAQKWGFVDDTAWKPSHVVTLSMSAKPGWNPLGVAPKPRKPLRPS